MVNAGPGHVLVRKQGVQGSKQGTLSNEVTRQPMDLPTLIKSATPATKRCSALQGVGKACTEATACMFDLHKTPEHRSLQSLEAPF